MSSVVDWLTNIAESILQIPIEIGKKIAEIFEPILDWLNPTSDNFILKKILDFFIELLSYLNPFSDKFILKILFDWISDLLHKIFVPDTEKLKSQFDLMLEHISSKLGLSFDTLNELKNSLTELPASDIEENYNIYGVGTLKLKFLDTTYLAQGVERFRPVIRGFVVLLLVLYNYYQVLSFLGQDPRIASHDINSAQEHMKGKEK